MDFNIFIVKFPFNFLWNFESQTLQRASSLFPWLLINLLISQIVWQYE